MLLNFLNIFEYISWSFKSDFLFIELRDDEVVFLQPCFLDALPRHTEIMTDKGFTICDECAAKFVHLYPQEERCVSSS